MNIIPFTLHVQISQKKFTFVLISECKAKLDLGFLVDGSGSVGGKNFKKQLKFIKKMARAFKISLQETHVGLIVFDHNPKLIFGFDKFYDLRGVINAIGQVPHPSGGTKTGMLWFDKKNRGIDKAE